MTKPISEMSLEEIELEKAKIALERAFLNGAAVSDDVSDPELATAAEDDNEDVPEPWPHTTMEFAGRTLEVRKPDETALIAVSMGSIPSLGAQVQMRIFTQFLMHHLSPSSFVEVVIAMTDPDSGIDIASLIRALTEI